MKGLILTNQSSGQALAAEMVLRYYYDSLEANVTVKDCNGVSTGDLTTYIGTLVANTYDKIHVLITADTSGGTGKISHDQLASLFPKIKTAALPTATLASAANGANATVTEVVFTTGASAVDDAYNAMIAVVDVGDLHSSYLYRYIKDYVGTTATATVNTTSTAVTSTDTSAIYNIITATGPIYLHTVATAAHSVFSTLYPSMGLPRLISELQASTSEYISTATADSAANTSGVGSLTKADTWTAAEYTGGDYYVGIRSATLGAGQIRKIVSNTVSVLTLDAPWDPVPTGSIVYEITLNRWRCLNDYFLAFAMRYEFGTPYSLAKLEKFIKLLDVNSNFTTTTRYTFQDLEALEALHDTGETIMVSLGRGISS